LRTSILLFVGLSFCLTWGGTVVPASASSWIHVNGPEPPVVMGLAEAGGVLVLGTGEADSGDIFRSTDGGATWSNGGLPNGGVLLVYAHDGVFFLSTYLSGVYRSADAGQSWTPVNGIPGAGGDMAAIGSTIIFGTGFFGDRVIYRSSDHGISWAPVPGAPTLETRALLAVDNTFLLGSAGAGALRSTNGGLTWAPANSGLPSNANVDALGLSGAAVLAAVAVPGAPSQSGLYRSTNQGVSWSRISGDLPSGPSVEYCEVIDLGGVLFTGIRWIGSASGVYRSTNQGVNWTLVSQGLPADGQTTVLTAAGGRLHAGFNQGLYASTDFGDTWSYRGQGTSAIRGVGSLLASSDRVLVGLQTNGGLGRGVWKTTDEGGDWTMGTGLPEVGTAEALLEHEDVLYAAMSVAFPRGVFKSTDDGANWTYTSTGIPTNAILFSLWAEGNVMLAGAWEGIFRSTDQGASWSQVNGAPPYATAFVDHGGAVWAAFAGQGVARSTDRGATWTSINGGLTGNERSVNTLLSLGGALYMGSHGEGVHRLQGETWVPAGLDDHFVSKLCEVPGLIVAATALDDYLYWSDNDGAEWHSLLEGYHGDEPYELAALGHDLWVGTRGHGVWKRSLTDILDPAGIAEGGPGEDGPLAAARTGGPRIESIAPHPLGSSSVLRFRLEEAGMASFELFDPAGRHVATPLREWRSAGAQSMTLARGGLPAGVYWGRLTSGGRSSSERVVIR